MSTRPHVGTVAADNECQRAGCFKATRLAGWLAAVEGGGNLSKAAKCVDYDTPATVIEFTGGPKTVGDPTTPAACANERQSDG